MTLKDLKLNCDFINKSLTNQPFKIVDGHIGQINLDLHLENLLSSSIKVEIEKLHLLIEVKDY